MSAETPQNSTDPSKLFPPSPNLSDLRPPKGSLLTPRESQQGSPASSDLEMYIPDKKNKSEPEPSIASTEGSLAVKSDDQSTMTANSVASTTG
jgi:hypothetical protein